jgi:hypothetical protein
MIEWDIREYVWVKLTDSGRQIHREDQERLADQIYRRSGVKQSYTPPAADADADADGWSRFPGWYLMKIFGPHIGPNADPFFEATVRIERFTEVKDSQ